MSDESVRRALESVAAIKRLAAENPGNDWWADSDCLASNDLPTYLEVALALEEVTKERDGRGGAFDGR